MTVSLQTPEDIINYALAKIGSKRRIGSIYDGTEASKAALDVYAQTRDQLLRDGEWGFARRDVAMTLLKQAPAGGYVTTAWDPAANPPIPYLYEYTYPADCLKVRAVKAPPLFTIDFDPQPVIYSTPNDNAYTPARKVIVCNVGPDALLTYAAQVTDPSTWESSFTEALAAALGVRLAPTLTGPQMEQIEEKDEMIETARADATQG